MLGIHRLSPTGADYYLADLAQELPPGGARQVEWVGGASAKLGLDGAIHPDHLRSLLDGHHPRTGSRLGTGRANVPGFDLTFSAPKSVSLLMGLGGADVAGMVVEAHGEAVSGALSYLEAHGVSARRSTQSGREVIPTSGVVGASFTHGVNRNLDPHLHTHVVVANLVHGVDGRWGALDGRGLSAHRVATSAVYGAHLRAGLSRRLGVQWDHIPPLRFEVSGVSPVLRGEFSSRAADIHRQMHEWGSHSPRASRLAWAATRQSKPRGVQFDDLSLEWTRRADAADPAGPSVAGTLGPDRDVEPLNEHRFRAVLSLSPDGAARRRDVVTAFSTAAGSGAPAATVGRLSDLWLDPRTQGEVGVAEPAGPLRPLVPGGHLLRALGPRPVDPDAHAVWRDAAMAVETFRQHWGVTTSADALGVDALASGLAGVPVNRLVDHLRTAQHIETARRRLGWREPRSIEMERGR
jgi:conjugative relaxase-like TrwC/TraI family protein